MMAPLRQAIPRPPLRLATSCTPWGSQTHAPLLLPFCLPADLDLGGRPPRGLRPGWAIKHGRQSTDDVVRASGESA